MVGIPKYAPDILTTYVTVISLVINFKYIECGIIVMPSKTYNNISTPFLHIISKLLNYVILTAWLIQVKMQILLQ